MTRLDASLPATPLLMVRNRAPITCPNLPEGYAVEKYPESRKEDWIDLMMDLGFFHTRPEAEEKWLEMDSHPDYSIHHQFCMVNDSNGALAAACALWPGKDFEELPLRIHFVGTSVDHQKKGLGRYVLARCLQQSIEAGMDRVYLSTQAQSWPAILLYQEFGFQPWMKRSARYTADQNQAAWQDALQILERKSAHQMP